MDTGSTFNLLADTGGDTTTRRKTPAMTNPKPWYLTRRQWQAELQARAWDTDRDRRWATEAAHAAATRIPSGIPPAAWARMTDVEQAQAWMAHHRHAELLASQRRTRTTLIAIFVVIPLAVLLAVGIYLLAAVASNAKSQRDNNASPTSTSTACMHLAVT